MADTASAETLLRMLAKVVGIVCQRDQPKALEPKLPKPKVLEGRSMVRKQCPQWLRAGQLEARGELQMLVTQNEQGGDNPSEAPRASTSFRTWPGLMPRPHVLRQNRPARSSDHPAGAVDHKPTPSSP